MFFASDNGAGASPRIVEAVGAALSAGPALAYGADAWTKRVEQRFCDLFEREVAVFLLTSGTAANALALAHVTPAWGAVFCHEESHSNASECGAPEFYGGMKLIGLPGAGGKIAPSVLEAGLRKLYVGDPHSVQPATLSLTNLTECGTLYRPDEITALTQIARAHGLTIHLDGARLANAVAAARCTPAEMTWKAGVDVLSFGATKGGAIAAEAVVFFDPKRAKDFAFRRLRGGHLLSKMRFVAAQFDAWLADGHWLALAGHANGMARRLAAALQAEGLRIAWPVEGNEAFVVLPAAFHAELAASGVRIADWRRGSMGGNTTVGEHEILGRFVCSFATREEEVDQLVAMFRAFSASARAAERGLEKKGRSLRGGAPH
jgi:threonine aldolase